MAKKRQKKKKTGNQPNKKLTELREAAHNGDPDAQVGMGLLYMAGEEVSYNPQRAFDYFSKAANAGHNEGFYYLGMLYMRGEGCEKDYDQAKICFTQAKNLGNEQAKSSLSYLNSQIAYEQEDQKRFKEALEKANKGDQEAKEKLGEYYIYGIGTKSNSEEGLKILNELADENNGEAIIALSDAYHNENLPFYDEEKALHYDEMGASVGIASCLHNVAAYHINNDQFDEGFALLKEAAESDSPVSNMMCAYYYYEGKKVKEDKKQVYKYLKRALELKFDQAYEILDYLISLNYFNYDQNVALAKAALVRDTYEDYSRLALLLLTKKENFKDALDILKMAADKGDYQAANIYRVLMKNPDDPAKILIDDAERGSDADAYQLATLYSSGIILPKDDALCAHWLSIAIDRGSIPAKSHLGVMYMNGTGVRKDTKKGLALLEEAAAVDDINALNTLEAVYRTGQGVPVNHRKADKYARRAEKLEQNY